MWVGRKFERVGSVWAKRSEGHPHQALAPPVARRADRAGWFHGLAARYSLHAARPAAAKPSGPTKAQLRKVAQLEARLDAADEAAAAELAELDARRAALAAKHERARTKLVADLAAAREAVERAQA